MNSALWRGGQQLPDIPRHPSEYKGRLWGDLDSALEALPGPFRYPIFGDRSALFLQQYVGYEGGSLSWLRCNFYERLRSPEELINAVILYRAYAQRGLNYLSKGVPPPSGMPNIPILVSLAVEIFPSIYSARDGIVPLPEGDEGSIGKHLVPLIGIDDDCVFFQNSWGKEWGKNGTGCFSIDYLRRFQREAWSMRFLAGPPPAGVHGAYLIEGGSPGPSEERFYQLLNHSWEPQVSSPFFLLSKDGTLNRAGRVDIAARWLIGAGEGCVWLQSVAILRDVDADPIIVGWMHVRATHSGGVVEELFVWPPYRELGIGTALAGQTLLHVYPNPALQKLDWTWYEPEADMMVRQRSRTKPHIPSWLNALLTGDVPAPVVQREQGDIKLQLLGWIELIAKTQARWC